MRDAHVELALAALDASPQAFAAVGPDGRVVAYNTAAEQLLGWSRDEVLGRPDPSVPDEGWARYDVVVDRLRASPDTGPELARRMTKSGDEVVLAVDSYVRLPALGGHIVGAFFRPATDDEVRTRGRNELSRALVEATSVAEVLRAAGVHARDVLGTDTGVTLVSSGRGYLRGEHAIGLSSDVVDRLRLPLSASEPWTRALASGHSIGWLDLPGRAAQPTLFVAAGPPKEQQLVAFVYEGAVPRRPALHAQARAFADELWLALQRAQLVAELEDKIELLEATHGIAAVVGLDLDETVQQTVSHVAGTLDAERAAVYLRHGGYPRLIELLDVSSPEAADHGRAADAGAGLAHRVLEQGGPLVIDDTDGADVADGPWSVTSGARSVLAVPLDVGGRRIGVLVAARTGDTTRPFTPRTQRLGDAIARQAAIAIDHALLFRREQERVRELRDRDQQRTDHVAGLTHDLRTPLTGLLGFTETLRRLGDAASVDDRERYLAAMERQATRLVGMVEEMLVADRLEGGALAPAERVPLAVADIVSEALDGFELSRRARIDVQVDGRLTVRGDLSQLSRVVRNLIENGLKYGPDQGRVEVSVTRDGGDALVDVRDEGDGLDVGEIDEVFARFRTRSRDERPAEAGSSGLGLFISRGTARAHGGDVEYVTPERGGPCFRVRLPLADPVPGRG